MKDPRKIRLPPAVPVVALLVSWGLGQAYPLAIAWPRWSLWLGLVLLILPLALVIWSLRTFRRHQTVVNPLGDVAGVVTDGPFRYTRNPMYLALMVLYAGVALTFQLPWAWLLLVPVLLVLHFGVIVPEERYLEAKFGESYARYKDHVRRWIPYVV